MMNSDLQAVGRTRKPLQSLLLRSKKEMGYGKIQYRLHDAIFSSKILGKPFQYTKMAYQKWTTTGLPAVEKYLPKDGEPPLARAENWKTDEGYILDTNTHTWYLLATWILCDGEFVSKNSLEEC